MGEELQQVRQYATLNAACIPGTLALREYNQKTSSSTVPRFASFKSKPRPWPSSESANCAGAEGSKGFSERKQVDRTPVDRTTQTFGKECESIYGRTQLHRSESRDRFKRPRAASRGHTDQVEEDSSNVFRVDRVGDPKNVTYGSLQRSSIPRYGRSSHGGVLGYQTLKIDRAISNEKELLLSTRWGGQGGKREKDALSHLAHLKPRKLKITADEADKTDFAEAAAYVPLRPRAAKNRKIEEIGAESESSYSSDDPKQRYRSVHSKSKGFRYHNDDDGQTRSSEDSATDAEHNWRYAASKTAQNKRAELLKSVQSDPSNCDAWLALVDYQDVLIRRDSRSQSVTMTRAERQSSAEVKISMYEDALNKARSMESKERLIVRMMEEGSKIWDSEALLSEWYDVLQRVPGSLKLWTLYLDFRQTAFSRFRYEEIRASFIQCLTLLRKAHADQDIAIAERDSIYLVEVYVIFRLTSFMREAGFSERAVATWQALLEFEICRPLRFLGRQHTSADDFETTMLSSFEDFWDSEVPRIGEEGAAGWARFDAEQAEPPQSIVDAKGFHGSNGELSTSWAFLERQKSLGSRRPARTIDDVDENDPYRIILFSDVRDVLELLPTSSLNHPILIAGWFAFCHLPPWTSDDSAPISRKWYRDQFSHTETPAQCSQSEGFMALNCPYVVAGNEGISNTHEQSGPEIAGGTFEVSTIDHELSTESLFSSKGKWFSTFGTMIREYADDCGPVDVTLLRKTLLTLVETDIRNDSLAEYFLALELRLSPDTVRKTAKNLLRRRPESLRLYNAYASIEYQMGNGHRAQDVVVSAINTSQILPESSQADAIYLWRTWTWELLSSEKPKESLECLLSYPGHHLATDHSAHEQDTPRDPSVRPAVLLRAQQALAALRDHFLTLARPIHSFMTCDLLILLTYLYHSASLSSALTVFEANLLTLETRFSSTSPAQELLHQSFARLLYHHATHAPLFKPATIRERLATSIALYPHNTILLSVYAWNEARFRIDDRVRTVIKDVVLGSTIGNRGKEDRGSVIPHFFSLHTELNRSVVAGSNTNTIRNTFERAVSDPAGAHCVGLWKSYILFEIKRGESRRARTVWWRGVQACPWAQNLWMMGFWELKNEMSDEELKGLYELMVEKELRVHVDLIELLEAKA